ncbi:hypothetical protein BV25DRAFT_708624 [Artomyces pyxidatus]|uniref:Uncharacterized protein n=1 Tax=Artomyces pyxidatus TaxID=48021 RepID=A0ACB8T056_9AGAM|nr:hypothetical protein BV25DRAFT_708624 [Artomyces pyxidatus]
MSLSTSTAVDMVEEHVRMEDQLQDQIRETKILRGELLRLEAGHREQLDQVKDDLKGARQARDHFRNLSVSLRRQLDEKAPALEALQAEVEALRVEKAASCVDTERLRLKLNTAEQERDGLRSRLDTALLALAERQIQSRTGSLTATGLGAVPQKIEKVEEADNKTCSGRTMLGSTSESMDSKNFDQSVSSSLHFLAVFPDNLHRRFPSQRL